MYTICASSLANHVESARSVVPLLLPGTNIDRIYTTYEKQNEQNNVNTQDRHI